MSRRSSMFLAAICAAAAVPSLPAQQEPGPPPKQGKGHPETAREKPKRAAAPEVIVTATRREEKVYDIPRSITVVDRQELLEKAPRTVAEALRLQPGIWVQKTGHLGGAPVIRGFMGNQVIYLFDGIRRNTAGLFKGPNSFLQNIDSLDVDRIEVIRGPGSVLYGSDAIGGVINVISNEELGFSAAPTYGGRLYGRYASVDHENSGRAEGYFTQERMNAFFGVSRRNIQDLQSGRGGGLQIPASWYEHDWDGQLGYKLAENQRLDFYVQSFTRPEGLRFDRPNWKQRNDRDLYSLRYLGRELGFAKSLKATAWYHNQSNFIDEKYWDSDSKDRTVGLEVQAESDLGDDLNVVYGFTGLKDDINKNNPQKGTADPQVDWTNLAGFALGTWDFSEQWRLDLGLRLDSFQLDSTSPAFSKLDPDMQSAINNGALSLSDLNLNRNDLALTGGLGLSWLLNDNVTVYSHIGRAFRAPNKSDMLSFGAFTFGFNVPSSQLQPESSWTYELGVKAQGQDSAVSLATYMTVVSNGIVSQPGTFNGSSFIDLNGNGTQDAGEQVYVKLNSPDDIVVRGVELQGVQYLPKDWVRKVVDMGEMSLYGNFTWMRGKDKGTNEPLDRGIPTNAVLGLRWEESRIPAERNWWMSMEAWMVNSFDRIPSSRFGDPAFHQDPQNTSSPFLAPGPRVPGYTVFNARGGVKLNPRTTLTFAVENIGDKLYRVKDSRIDAPGTNFVTALEVRF